MSEPRRFAESELHAYVDGALDRETREAVQAWLADHPQDRAKVESWGAQNDALHALYDGVLDEPVPPRMTGALTAAPVRHAPARHGPSRWMQAAAAVVLLVAGFALGWGYRDTFSDQLADQRADQTAAGADLISQAIGAHVVFTGEKRHAVEVWADKEERHLVRWLSKRLGQPIRPPPLGDLGFRLVGGRLIADRGGPAAQFMYEDSAKRRMTLYVRRSGGDTDTAFRFVSVDGVAAFYWMDQALSYAVIARMERAELLKLARIVYGALGS